MSYEEPPDGQTEWWIVREGVFSIECVVVCVGYADFLRCTLPFNKHLFDRIVVVTEYADKATRKLCEYWHVECIPTLKMDTHEEGVFRKGVGINIGLDALSLDGWALHMDADMLLPPQTRILLEQASLDPSMIFGIDRHLVKGYKAFDAFLEQPKLQQENGAYIHTTAFPVGARVMSGKSGGYVPIGFFQMWNPKVSGVTSYPEGHTGAGREDMLFGAQWPRHKRALIPEIIGYHLESVDAKMASNWNGRTTAPFTHASEA